MGSQGKFSERSIEVRILHLSGSVTDDLPLRYRADLVGVHTVAYAWIDLAYHAMLGFPAPFLALALPRNLPVAPFRYHPRDSSHFPATPPTFTGPKALR